MHKTSWSRLPIYENNQSSHTIANVLVRSTRRCPVCTLNPTWTAYRLPPAFCFSSSFSLSAAAAFSFAAWTSALYQLQAEPPHLRDGNVSPSGRSLVAPRHQLLVRRIIPLPLVGIE